MIGHALEGLLARVRGWWRREHDLDLLDAAELDRIARDLGMSAGDLERLAARGPDAADLLYARLRALGMTAADFGHAKRAILRDLERTCACCGEKGICAKDLARDPADPAWKGYCPNADTLDALTARKG